MLGRRRRPQTPRQAGGLPAGEGADADAQPGPQPVSDSQHPPPGWSWKRPLGLAGPIPRGGGTLLCPGLTPRGGFQGMWRAQPLGKKAVGLALPLLCSTQTEGEFQTREVEDATQIPFTAQTWDGRGEPGPVPPSPAAHQLVLGYLQVPGMEVPGHQPVPLLPGCQVCRRACR